MSQHDQNLSNANGLTFRTDLNNALVALFSSSSGSVEPTTKIAGQLWFDTSVVGTNVLKMRDQTNASWITIWSLANETYDEQFAKFTGRPNVLYNADFSTNLAGYGTIASVAGASQYFCDGWQIMASATGASGTQILMTAVAPGAGQVGIGRGRITIQTAKGSLAAGDYLGFNHPIEGADIRLLDWGYANAKPGILRFGFKGPAGTYSASIYAPGTPIANYVRLFTVSAGEANTDKTVVLAIPAPPAVAASWPITNVLAASLRIGLASGSTFTAGAEGWSTTNFVGGPGQSNGWSSTSNVFELFDVRLSANPDNYTGDPGFNPETFQANQARCHRYLYMGHPYNAATAGISGQGYRIGEIKFPVTMRTTPVVGTGAAGTLSNCTINDTVVSDRGMWPTLTATATAQISVTSRTYNFDAQL
jgi:hypothetical protein